MLRVLVLGALAHARWDAPSRARALAQKTAVANPPLLQCEGDTAPPYTDVSQFLTNARLQDQQLVESRHVVAMVPRTASFASGEAAVSAALYAKLPSAPDMEGTGFEMALTKVVVVGSDAAAEEGVYFPGCGFADTEATAWLEEAGRTMTNGPAVLASRAAPPTVLSEQVPYLGLLLGAKMQGNVLPVVLGKPQEPPPAGEAPGALGQRIGDLLTKLVRPGGPYAGSEHRVLFLFAADLSHQLPKDLALARDTETVEKMTTSGFGPLLVYFENLREAATEACETTPAMCGESRRPVDYACVLGAVQLASNLGFQGAKVRVASSGDFGPGTDRNMLDPVRGFAAVVFTKDERTPGQIMSAQAAKPAAASTTTSTTTVVTTMVPPPTLMPAPFGSSPPAFLDRRSRRWL